MGEYYKIYTIPEFMQVYYELSESEVSSFKAFCESKGKSDKEGITSVLTVLIFFLICFIRYIMLYLILIRIQDVKMMNGFSHLYIIRSTIILELFLLLIASIG